MHVALTTEQRELASVVRSFLDDHAPEAEVRRQIDDDRGWDRDAWKISAAQLGLQALAIPEQYGGAGFGMIELGVCFEEMGRALWPAPFFSTIGLAAPLLLALQDEGANKEYLPALASGELLATVALSENARGWDLASVTTRAEHGAGGWMLTGDKNYVVDGGTADLLLVVARTSPDELRVFAVECTTPHDGLARHPVPGLDPTRALATVTLRGVPARLVGDEASAVAAVAAALDVSCALLAAEQVGGTARVLDMAVRYAGERHQFGRPIGSFQAVKHRCASMLVALEGARSAAYSALRAAARADPDLARHAALAKSYCSDAFTRCASDNVHVHGGIGTTWEHPAHLYLKRARSSELLLGSPSFHRARLAALVWPPV